MAGTEPAVAPTRDVVAPTHEDPLARSLSAGIGGPVGARAVRHRWLTPMFVVMLLTGLTFAITMLAKSPCYDSSFNDVEDRYGKMCYSDLPPLYSGRGFSDLHWPYSAADPGNEQQRPMEYPVGISYWAYGTAVVTEAIINAFPDDSNLAEDGAAQMRLFYLVNVLGFALLALITAFFLVRAAGRRPWDAALFAVSPVVVATALINWDFLAVALVAAILWAWARGRWKLTGVLIGLGVAAKLYPLFLLGAVLVICWRNRRMPVFWTVTGVAALTWAVANAPALITSWATDDLGRWTEFWTFNSDRPADLGSAWLAVQHLGGVTFDAHTINVWSWLLFGLWCVVVAVLGLTTPRTPRFAQLGFLIVAGFLIVNKVYSPQYVLWLLPLAVLARPRWRDQIIWQAGELVYFAAIWWYLGGWLKDSGGEDSPAYDIAIIVRIAAEVYLMAIIIRDMYRPDLDVVRRTEVDPTEPAEPARSVDQASGPAVDTEATPVAEPGRGPSVPDRDTPSDDRLRDAW